MRAGLRLCGTGRRSRQRRRRLILCRLSGQSHRLPITDHQRHRLRLLERLAVSGRLLLQGKIVLFAAVLLPSRISDWTSHWPP
jgi:hypothetical protein